MNAPPLILGSALLFWGWGTGLLAVAAPLALLIESPRVIRTRWEVTQEDFNRLWNLCSLAFIGAFIYAVWANEGASYVGKLFQTTTPGDRVAAFNKTTRSVLVFFQWLPMIFFPFTLVQAFSQKAEVDFSTFSLLLRRRKARQAAVSRAVWRGSAVNVTYPYLAVLLISAGAANPRGPWFFAGTLVLVAWALWPHRSPRYSWLVWSFVLVLGAGAGYGGVVGLEKLEALSETVRLEWLSRFFKSDTDTRESRTALGSVGRLKLSGRIVLRVETDAKSPPPLLREASYNTFTSATWKAMYPEFGGVLTPPDGETWILQRQLAATNWIRISRYLTKGQGLLALGPGPARLEKLPVASLETNLLGAARVDGGPGLIRYVTRFREGAVLDGPPTTNDTVIPLAERAVIDSVAAELRFGPGSSNAVRETLQAVNRFFQQQFTYSLNLQPLPRGETNQTALGDFFLKTRSGHCEYFATATVLLLRKAGIPARYAVGYVAHEGSGGRYVVRERDAHAWCLAWVGGTWRDIDNTPASWRELEAQNASLWEPAYDLFSRLWYEFSKWRWGESSWRQYLIWPLIALGIFLLARTLYRARWKRVVRPAAARLLTEAFPGGDSEFYQIERHLAAAGLGRRPDETMRQWLGRLRASAVQVDLSEPTALVDLHYRLRFDPSGLAAAQRTALAYRTATWLDREATRVLGRKTSTA